MLFLGFGKDMHLINFVRVLVFRSLMKLAY